MINNNESEAGKEERMIIKKVKVAIQCEDIKTGETGDFGFLGEKLEAVTPIFSDLVQFFNYLDNLEIERDY